MDVICNKKKSFRFKRFFYFTSELEGCEVVVELEHLETHLLKCEYNPNAEIICDWGCKSKIHRHELLSHNCSEYLLNLVSLKDVEITKLTSALSDQKEECRKLTRELNDRNEVLANLQLALIDRDEQITHHKQQNIELLKSQVVHNSEKWKISRNLRFCEETNILEFVGPADHASDRGHAQSNYHLTASNSTFKIEVLSVTGLIIIGIATEADHSCFSGSTPKYLCDYENFKEKWNIGDIIGFEVKTCDKGTARKRLCLCFTRNGKLQQTWFTDSELRYDHFFPTISLEGQHTKVRVTYNNEERNKP